MPSFEERPAQIRKVIFKLQQKSNLDYLALAEHRTAFQTPQDELSHLITSLRSNYYSYVKYKKLHDPTFFSVANIDLPPMKDDSPFKCMEPFIRTAKAFLDGKMENQCVFELVELEKEIDRRYMQIKSTTKDGEILARIMIFLDLLEEFEKRTGFSTPVEIAKDAGPNKDGLISPNEFNRLVLAGHPFVDYGATIQHGPHSHRVQFYLLDRLFHKKAAVLFNADNLAKIRAIILQFKMFPAVAAADLTDKFILSHFTSIFYKMFGIKEFTSAFNWEKFKADLKEENNRTNLGRAVPFDMNIPHIWVQLFDRRGYKGEGSVPSTFGILQLLGALKGMPRLGVPNTCGSASLRDIISITKPIHSAAAKSKAHDYLDLAVSTRFKIG